MTSDDRKYILDTATHERIFYKEIVPVLFSRAASQERPIAVFIGGQPGAGKSQTFASAIAELNGKGGVIAIAGDNLRHYHPMYSQLMRTDDQNMARYTNTDAGRWVEPDSG